MDNETCSIFVVYNSSRFLIFSQDGTKNAWFEAYASSWHMKWSLLGPNAACCNPMGLVIRTWSNPLSAMGLDCLIYVGLVGPCSSLAARLLVQRLNLKLAGLWAAPGWSVPHTDLKTLDYRHVAVWLIIFRLPCLQCFSFGIWGYTFILWDE